MSFLSEIIINVFEKELKNATPEIEAFALKTLSSLGSEIMAYVTYKIVAQDPPKVPVQTPQSVE